MLKKKYILIPFITIVAIGAYFAFSNQTPTIDVKRVDVVKNTVNKTVSATGLVTSPNDASLAFAASGKIAYIGVSKGDSVKKGQVLASLDQASVQQTLQALKDARDIALRNKELFLEKYVDHYEDIGGFDQFEINRRNYEEQLSQAEATYQAQKKALSNYYIYSPFEGTVTKVSGEVGEVATAAVEFVHVSNLDILEFEILLDQEDIGLVSLGQKVELALDSYQNHKFSGKVKDIASFSTDGDHFEVTIEIDLQQDKNILLGMRGDAYIVTSSTNNEVSALEFDHIYVERDGTHYVWVLKNNQTIIKKTVEIGLEGDIYTEIKTDLSGLELVVPIDSDKTVEEGFKAKLLTNGR